MRERAEGEVQMEREREKGREGGRGGMESLGRVFPFVSQCD